MLLKDRQDKNPQNKVIMEKKKTNNTNKSRNKRNSRHIKASDQNQVAKKHIQTIPNLTWLTLTKIPNYFSKSVKPWLKISRTNPPKEHWCFLDQHQEKKSHANSNQHNLLKTSTTLSSSNSPKYKQARKFDFIYPNSLQNKNSQM